MYKRWMWIVSVFFLMFAGGLFGQEGEVEGGEKPSWIQQVGELHPVILHFPIALITMTAIAEVLFAWFKNPLFDQAARFMLIAAAITAIPTALFGLAWSYSMQYSGMKVDFFWWHRFVGIFTMVLAIVTVYLREKHLMKAYYWALLILFVSVNTAGFLGGVLTFGLPAYLK